MKAGKLLTKTMLIMECLYNKLGMIHLEIQSVMTNMLHANWSIHRFSGQIFFFTSAFSIDIKSSH